ncbi:permease [bacterium]
MLNVFFNTLYSYCIEIIPVLIMGFILSGIIHEIIPQNMVQKYLGGRSIKGILYSTLIGALVPVCCWGSLPIAVTFYKQGASLGAIFAMLIATPATSVTAFLVMIKFMGFRFALFMFFAVIVMGVSIGIITNKLKLEGKKVNLPEEEHLNHEHGSESCLHCIEEKKKISSRLISILQYAFIEMPKSLGVSLSIGIILAAVIKSLAPLEYVISNFITGFTGYLFSLIFGLTIYMCATMSVPMVDALITKGLEIGPALVLLLVGPITSYGTILVLRKEFGLKILIFYLTMISVTAVILGYIFSII